jgi:glycosyltransferase involved in cell wall biosynthesis
MGSKKPNKEIEAGKSMSSSFSPCPGQQITLVIPAYNEAESLSEMLPGLVNFFINNEWGIIIVNDGSTDNTPEVLSGYQHEGAIRVVRHKMNRGYGGALKSGLKLAETEFVVTMDADGQHQYTDIENLCGFMIENDADMVIGSRCSSSSSSTYRRIGKWVIRTLTKILVPNSICDMNSGFKMYRTKLVQRYLHLCPDSMAFSDVITLVFINRHHLVLEFPIQTASRTTGKSTISTYTALDTLFEILNIIMLFNPMRIFLPIALMSIFFGFVWGLPILFMGRGVSVGSMLAIVTGLIFMFLGLVSEQLSKLRLQSIDITSSSDDTSEVNDSPS